MIQLVLLSVSIVINLISQHSFWPCSHLVRNLAVSLLWKNCRVQMNAASSVHVFITWKMADYYLLPVMSVSASHDF